MNECEGEREGDENSARETYIYIYMHACNLIWWAVLGLQAVMKQQVMMRNKGKR